MAFGVVEKKQVSAKTDEALVRTGVSTAVVENGSVFSLGTRNSNGTWNVGTPATGSLTNLWMAADDGKVVISSDGREYQVTNDPTAFSVAIGRAFDIFKPQIGDLIALSADAIDSTYAGEDFVVAADGEVKLQKSATAITGLSLKKIATTTIKVPSTTLGTPDGVTAYLFEVTAV